MLSGRQAISAAGTFFAQKEPGGADNQHDLDESTVAQSAGLRADRSGPFWPHLAEQCIFWLKRSFCVFPLGLLPKLVHTTDIRVSDTRVSDWIRVQMRSRPLLRRLSTPKDSS